MPVWLKAKYVRPAAIQRELFKFKKELLRKCWLFEEGRINLHDEEESGRPPPLFSQLIEKANEYKNSGKQEIRNF